jgi:hypothetical protein
MSAVTTVKVPPPHTNENERNVSVVSFYHSGALIAVCIFAALFLVFGVAHPITHGVTNPGHKASVDVWCKRFENFLVSSDNPDIQIMGSSLILVSSQACDMKFAGLEIPYDAASWTRGTEGYLTPRYLLARLQKEGRPEISAVNLGIPSSVICDNLLLTKQSLAFGKHPKLVVYAIAPRDFIINATKDKKTPVEEVLGDVGTPITWLPRSSLIRWLDVRMRPYSLAQNWDDDRFYFREELSKTPAALRQIAQPPQPKTQSPNEQRKPLSILDDLLFHTNKQLDFRQMTNCYENVDQKFFDKQFTALEESAKLLQRHGVRLVLVEMPLPPGNLSALPPALSQTYFGRLDALSKQYGLTLYRPELEEKFADEDFQDDSHLNAFGAAKFFNRLARVIAHLD